MIFEIWYIVNFSFNNGLFINYINLNIFSKNYKNLYLAILSKIFIIFIEIYIISKIFKVFYKFIFILRSINLKIYVVMIYYNFFLISLR